MQQEFIKEATFKITQKQVQKLRPYLPNIDELIQGELEDFQDALSDRMLDFLDAKNDYEPTKIGIMLEDIYDEIYYQN